MNRGLRAPVASVSGQDEVLPALSVRLAETEVPFLGPVAANAIVAAVSAGTTVEISIENPGAAALTAHFIATANPPAGGADRAELLANRGFRRRVPAGAQLIEIRAVVPGDTVLVTVDAAAIVRVHSHTGAA